MKFYFIAAVSVLMMYVAGICAAAGQYLMAGTIALFGGVGVGYLAQEAKNR